jgi:hypothetical protein
MLLININICKREVSQQGLRFRLPPGWEIFSAQKDSWKDVGVLERLEPMEGSSLTGTVIVSFRSDFWHEYNGFLLCLSPTTIPNLRT